MESLTKEITNMTICSQTPNLGGKRLNLIPKSDAANVHCYQVEKIARGFAMPFRHPEFAKLYYKSIDETLYNMFSLISLFAQIRNHRVMRKCNEQIAKHEGKKLFTFTPEMEELDSSLPKLLEDAKALYIDPSAYLDESTDVDDVEQCTNSWCLNQNPSRGKASDNIIVITDLDKIDWFVLIERQNGPGRAQVAWAGGFVDKDETFTEAALRELGEEIDMTIVPSCNVSFTITNTELPVIISNDWDPRAKFVEGMENGATVTHYRFTST